MSLTDDVLEMIDDPRTGGLAGLVRQFEAGGLGGIIAGWIGTGPNPPITPAQIRSILPGAQLERLAGKSGLSLDACAEQLATVLPEVVDCLTPDGQVPVSASPLNEALDYLDGRSGSEAAVKHA